MGKTQILEKLSKKFGIAPSSEEDIVYALSRIRKVLEMQGHPEKYSILNFYCNLALHSEIERCPKIIEDMFIRVDNGEYSNSIINFIDFHNQLVEFSREFGLPNWSGSYKISEFNRFLNSIFSDTPITLKRVAFEIVIDANGLISVKKVI
ncbi:MAG: hypothetical protein PHT51_02455 [Patescibacteria group bacterium]|nr:hypothetical protein [Patescibacteria group bacterium]MDD4611279.1 hypothetical protein [Patescibacteria group bacterium]